MSFNAGEFGYTPVTPEDTFNYHCDLCGDCCRNVKYAVMVESLDLFRLSQFLKMSVQDVILKYANMAYLSWCFPIFLLRTTNVMDACVFLKDSKCSVQSHKPRTCRTYPLGVVPDEENKGKFHSFIVSKKQHHFTGKAVRVRDWMDANQSDEDRAFITADFSMTQELTKLLPTIDKLHEQTVKSNMLFYKYLNYDTSKSFMEQFIRNMACLKFELTRLKI